MPSKDLRGSDSNGLHINYSQLLDNSGFCIAKRKGMLRCSIEYSALANPLSGDIHYAATRTSGSVQNQHLFSLLNMHAAQVEEASQRSCYGAQLACIAPEKASW